MVSQGRRAVNVWHAHEVYMFSYCTSYQQLVKMSSQSWLLVFNLLKNYHRFILNYKAGQSIEHLIFYEGK